MAKNQEHGFDICGIKYCKKNSCCNLGEIIKALKEGRCNLHNIKNEYKTPEVCKEAIKINPFNIRYVEQTSELCLEAVKENGRALEYVKEQTPEICTEALLQTHYANFCIKNEWRKETPEDTLKFLMNRIESEDFHDFLNTGSIEK